jgi:hypothetical protein
MTAQLAADIDGMFQRIEDWHVNVLCTFLATDNCVAVAATDPQAGAEVPAT